jgi:hypothetical protein
MAYTILDGPGTELTITDVHTTRTYCIYGAYEKDGPYMFIDSTYGDPVSSTITNLDLAVFYDPIYATVYPGTPTVNYVFLVTSTYEDEEPVPPVLPVASIALTFLGTTCQDSSVHLSGLGSSAATGIVSYA